MARRRLPARHRQQDHRQESRYIIALKANQGTPHEDVKVFAAEQTANGFKEATISRHETIEADHGRVETRTTTMIHDVAWLQERHDWPGLKGVVMVESQPEINGKITRETRFYITSLSAPTQTIGPMIRDHWAIENCLHWVMDMVFRDAEWRGRTDHAPANFTTLKHLAHNLARRAPGKGSVRLERKTAAWADDFLASLVAARVFHPIPLDNMAQNYPAAIKPFRQRVRRMVARSGAWPPSAQEVAERPGVHVVLLVRYPYKAFYRIEGDSVAVPHIAHAARRAPLLRRRLFSIAHLYQPT